MQTWWNASLPGQPPSPFFDIGVYIGGASLSCSNPNLESGWVTTVQSQGWGLIPLWVGPQAPCACWPKYPPPQCVPFPHVFSNTPSVAQTQGVAEANSAMSATAALGIPGGTYRSIVYYDLEQYTSSTRGPAATGFINGWVNQLNIGGYDSGVYGAPADAQNDWAPGTATYPPQSVWIAKLGSNSLSAPVVTVWGLSPLCDPFSSPPCNLWSNNQRIHQYLGNTSVSFGGVPLTVDYDAVDAAIFVANASKSYSTYTVAPIGVFTSTTPTAINDEGVVVGYASVPEGTYGCPIFDWCGFVYSGGNYTWVQQQLQGEYEYTYFTGINNVGTVVGYSGIYGFSYVYSTGAFTQLNYPGAQSTFPAGINDRGIVVGSWGDGTNFHGFISVNGAFTSYDYPGAQDTYLNSINGDGQIVGEYYNGMYYSFVYNLPQATISPAITYPGATSTLLESNLNNNGQVGGVADLSDGSLLYFLYDENSSSFATLPASITNASSGINDQGQLVGGLGSGAFLATPQ
jgi:hypothetical protein